MPSRELELLLQALDQAYERRSWHGPNLRGALRGLTAERAAWRPADDRHNIWEIALHAAYWKYVVRRRLLGQKRGSFPLVGSNWFRRPTGQPTAEAWRADLALLDEAHRSLREAVAALRGRALDRPGSARDITPRFLITGIAAHDLYHAGQIRLIERLHPARRTRAPRA